VNYANLHQKLDTEIATCEVGAAKPTPQRDYWNARSEAFREVRDWLEAPDEVVLPMADFTTIDTFIIAGRGTVHTVRKNSGIPRPRPGETVILDGKEVQVVGVENLLQPCPPIDWERWSGVIGLLVTEVPL